MAERRGVITMKKEAPIITHTEILSRAARSIELEIEDWERKAESLPGAAGMLDQVISGLREKLEAVRTLYRIETGSDL
jgi:hypothetical protein